MFPLRTTAASASFALLVASFILVPAHARVGAGPPTAPATQSADPWDVATRDPALAKVYETVSQKLLLPARDTPESIASEKHIAARLVDLNRTDPTNAFPAYLLAHIAGRYGNWKSVTGILRAGNAAPRVVYPLSGDVLNRAYPAGIALRNLAAIASVACASGALTDAEVIALLTEVRTMGNRLARQGEPRTPILIAVGSAIRLTAEKGLAAAHDRAGRTTEAVMARATEAKVRAWNEEAVKHFQTVLGKGGAEAPDVVGTPFGITAADIGNLLNHVPPTSAEKRRQVPAFNRALALSERRIADRTLKDMPD